MDIKILKKLNKTLSNDEIKITIEYNQNNSIYEDIENYLNQYKEDNNIIVVKNDYNHLIHLDKNHILKFFSIAKQNYCETIDNQKYMINKKLYEIEKLDKNYIRISKHCIVNLKNIKFFDMNSTRKNNC